MSTQDWLEKDFYKVLGVAKDATESEITKAYRKLARKYHPDANPGDESAEKKFKELSGAYDVVGDATKRAEYDEIRRMGPVGGFGRGAPGGFSGGGTGHNFDVGDLSDLFGMFNQGGAGAARAPAPVQGEDLQADLTISFDDAIHGVETSVHLTSDAPCSACKGSGAKPGTSPTVCPGCNGRGVNDSNQGFFSLSQPCHQCGGRGRIVTDICTKCRGQGIERRPRKVKVRVPAGVKSGQKIKIKGRGAPGRDGGASGDLVVKLTVGDHELFGRKGNNLTIKVPITFTEAALGSKVTVPTLEGDTVTLRVPEGTPTGQTFRVKGRGIETKSKTGDLLVTVEVAVPSKVDAAQREAIERLSRVATANPRAHFDIPRDPKSNGANNQSTGDHSESEADES